MDSDNSKSNQYKIEIPTSLRISRVIVWLMYAWTIFGVMVLTLRIFLLAAGANINNSFAWFVADTSNTYLQPFRGIFPQQPIGGNSYFDVSALFAAIVYLFIGWGFHALVNFIQGKIDQNTREQERQREEELARQQTSSNKRTTTTRKQ
jgi:uncharacterized protein YggT (Ycf19 family)